MFTIATVLLFTLLAQAWAAYIGFESLTALQSSGNTPERIGIAIPAIRGLVGTVTGVVVIASVYGIVRLRK